MHAQTVLQKHGSLLAYDLIHCPTVIAPLFAIVDKRIKTVMTVHDLVPALFPKLSNFTKYIYYKYVMRFVFPLVDYFIVPSQSVKRTLLNCFNIRPERIGVVYEGVSNEFRPGSKQKKNYILSVGTVEPRKNFRRVIDAFMHLKENYNIPEKLLIVGKKGWSCEDIYKIPRALENSILFTGYVSQSELIDLYQNAKLFVYPSLHEGFGLPVIEAMASGCPVVTSNLSSLPEISGDAAVLVDPYSVNDIAQSMLKIMEDEFFAASLAKKGLKQVQNFTWSNCAQETIKIYQTVLSK
jgi:glycosyltransferase involved in cell wall biosynthesis